MPASPDYKDTLNLPRTDFPQKANLPQREPAILEKWQQTDLYRRILEKNAHGEPFVFHDGPPYANGHIHQGHMLNKTLKDIVVKYRNLEGRLTDFVPGWDCHGLPIELQVDKKLGPKKRGMSKVEIREACRAHAMEFVDVQRAEFQRLGVFARWDEPYITMDYRYEADTVRMLGKFAERGGLFRGKKPVYWCIHDRTALAEAEVEYADHVSPTIYVGFDVVSGLAEKVPEAKGQKVQVVIWTTTPWTLPANLAVAVHPRFTYVLYRLDDRLVVVAKDLLAAFLGDVAPDHLAVKDVAVAGAELTAASLADPSRILAYVEGADLEGVRYAHPFLPRESPVILGDHVTLEQGTGLVHTAPGHGQEDYVVGLQYGLEVLNPVDDAGRFTPEAGDDLVGKGVFEANPLVVEKLRASGHLLQHGTVKHSYPHCWRCSNPVIFRGTDQWFISMETNDLRKKALAEVEKVRWIPKWGRDRIHGMLENRPDWCISRQRVWGVPITVAYCEGCGEPYLEPAIFENAARLFEQEGASAWFARPVSDFLPPGTRCAQCGGASFRPETDILDVWFDSGVSYHAVCNRRPNLSVPVDLYLEGSDQHRGWFHSTMLVSVGTEDRAPYKTVLTHGFVVDGEGKKISKKLGNYVDPLKLLQQNGADIMRLWVAAEDYRDDIRTSPQIFAQLAEGYFRIRNTLRYCLSNLFDFDPATDAVPADELPEADAYARARLQAFVARVRQAYEDYEFHLVYKAAVDFCAAEMSAFYLDARKDLLYTGRADGRARRAAQTVLFEIAREMTRLLSPILSFTCEEAWGHLPGEKPDSVFLAGLPTPDVRPGDAALVERFGRILAVRSAAQKRLEEARRDKWIGKSLEARVILGATGETLAFLRDHAEALPELLIVSQVQVVEGEAPNGAVDPATGVSVAVAKAAGEKCVRCWNYSEERGHDPAHPELCPKCTEALRPA